MSEPPAGQSTGSSGPAPGPQPGPAGSPGQPYPAPTPSGPGAPQPPTPGSQPWQGGQPTAWPPNAWPPQTAWQAPASDGRQPGYPPPPTGPGDRPPAPRPGGSTKIIIAVVVGVLVLALLGIGAALLFLRSLHPHRRDTPPPLPPSALATPSGSAPATSSGPTLSSSYAAMGYQCTQELASPLIHGCYSAPQQMVARWQGPDDRPAAIDVQGPVQEYQKLLMPFLEARLLQSQDVTQIVANAPKGSATLNTSYGVIKVSYNSSTQVATATGTARGHTSIPVKATAFQGSIAQSESALHDLGYTCKTTQKESDGYTTVTCTPAKGSPLYLGTEPGGIYDYIYADYAVDPKAVATLFKAVGGGSDVGTMLDTYQTCRIKKSAVYTMAGRWVVNCDSKSFSTWSVFWN